MPATVLVSDSWHCRHCTLQTTDTVFHTGNFVAPLTFKEEDAPAYGPGFVVVVATASATAVLGVIYRYLCVWENARRDKTCSEGYDHAYEDDVTDTKVSSLKTVGNVPIG